MKDLGMKSFYRHDHRRGKKKEEKVENKSLQGQVKDESLSKK
jgi:hypothetical protein